MAIDTRLKRASAITIGLYWRNLLPLADTAVDTAQERAQLAGTYGGYLPNWTPIPPGPTNPWTAIPAGAANAWTTIPAGPGGGWTPI